MDAGFNRNHSSEVSSPVAGHFPGYMDYQVGMRPQIPVERKWALGIQVEERGVPVEELLEADEVFCTGTVVVINPVFSVVCYLNNYGKDFNDGLFRFRDGQPMSIMPMAGDVLMYTAEQRNIHSVDEVYSIVLLSCMPLLTWPCLAKGVAVGISIAGTSGVLPLLICACVRYFQKKEKEKIKLPTEDFISSSTQDASSSGEYETLGSTAASASGLPAIMAAKSMEFSYQELAEATNNFSSDNKIGQGRFAAVYFAELRGQLVKINTKSPQTTKRWWSHEGINMSALKDIRKSLIILWRFHLNCGSKCFNQLKVVMGAAPTILLAIKSEENKLQEVMVGLAANVFTFMSSQESSYVFQEAGIIEVELASILVHILKKHKYPATKVLRIRRFAIEFAIWMMKDKAENIDTFKHMGMEKVLEGVLEITSELESFNVFSGTVGLNRHNLTIHSLVETAFKLLENR
ncbi:hypothetical protein Ahy_A02g005039 isoform C [Arachis hypogaea]|uniref:Uncharacterized protein n=1 Tax=Arachis hypogaea TaxID=3818 RepID=A0A445E5H5_ARAHY|nr:hypothetical protein Ahy_A02g005039 isoform C [Arachis hypogaea]